MTFPRTLLVLVLLLLVGPGALCQSGSAGDFRTLLEVRIHDLDRADVVALSRMGVDIDGVWGREARAFVYPARLAELERLGYSFTIVPGPLAGGRNAFAGYHTFATLTAELQAIEAAHPTLCKLNSIGNSVQGRPLWFMKISDNVNIEEDEPEFKYISSMHGDEPVGMELCMYLINELVNGYGTDPQITTLVDEAEIWIMPLMNPDGYENGQRYNMQGFDLNRNFPDRINDPNNTTAGRPTEVQHVMNFAFAHSSVLSANLHTGALVVNYPYDSDPNPWATYSASPDDALFIEQSLTYSRLNTPMYNSSWFNRGITNGVAWYLVHGGMQDWNYVWMGCNEVTIELSDTSWPNASKLPGLWNDNRAAMLAYMELCLTGVRGVVTDSVTGLPLAATVRAVGIDHDVFTDPDVGDYHRMLLPGSYDMRITAAGYRTTTVPNVVVGSGAATRLDIALVPSGGTDPAPDIRANGQNGPLFVSHNTVTNLTISLDPGSYAGIAHDWWVTATQANSFSWTFGGWKPFPARAYAGGLATLNGFPVTSAKIPVGSWTFTFAVDALNGTYEGTWKDTVDVTSY